MSSGVLAMFTTVARWDKLVQSSRGTFLSLQYVEVEREGMDPRLPSLDARTMPGVGVYPIWLLRGHQHPRRYCDDYRVTWTVVRHFIEFRRFPYILLQALHEEELEVASKIANYKAEGARTQDTPKMAVGSSPTEGCNITIVKPSGFYLVGLTNMKNSEYLLVFLFLVYVITLLGNFTLMAVVYLHPQLHTPRYMTVFNLAVVDVLHNTTLIPKILQAFLFNSNYIEFNACLTQCFFAHYATTMESASLVIMAYDRFVAICFPLRYPSINTNTKMFIIIASCWLFLIIPFLYMVLLITHLSNYASVEIPDFMCTYGYLYRITCEDISLFLRVGQTVSITILYGPLAFIFLTYVTILVAVCNLNSTENRKKSVSTCITHLILVLIFYVPLMVNYMLVQLSVTYSDNVRTVTVVLSSTLPPMLNPIIYSLKTEEVRASIFRAFKKLSISPR
ncbi:olfactory receptor 52E8-like [Latimeria chalumnae]|uniref:olfactory receptor 52E8-like n=1 Tax=Latimeria chalumnae TaxID=7897 RepID=UPI00313EDEE0